MTIQIGVTGWGDHDKLYPDAKARQQKLKTYATHFEVVEVDASFYAIQPISNYTKWVEETPEHFSFIIKAHQDMTGQSRRKMTRSEAASLFEQFLASIQPVVEAGKLAAILFQFPPWFQVEKASIDRLRYIRELTKGLPVAIEFRQQSWYAEEYRERTLSLLRELEFIHTVCDEPQAGSGSVPVVPVATYDQLTLVRFHGRNVHGWNQNGREDWRKVRFLYRYNQTELMEWRKLALALEQSSNRVILLFNNNSGGDASDNAKDMMQLLGQKLPDPPPEQLNLFD
ncbi:Uncharacterized conserved protein YecE, DUF72 family [Terribacillus halophilus]|uniref:Uncharacterized conserved protein YecE, DUF72 family n=1 Tax=Terribacillus halophilus TaxID=361279 RepID=A0A1G6V9Q7_9BACI|nr:DUF72 domain-containing protein [Terribacillus halophilus]SDD50308.1 Uncharacterized conserved protein YecE, DUF72 family [Terribacillus halophilus]